MSAALVGAAAAGAAVVAFLVGKKAASSQPAVCPPCFTYPSVGPSEPAQAESTVCEYATTSGTDWNIVRRVYISQATPSLDTQMIQAFQSDPNLHPGKVWHLYKLCRDAQGIAVVHEQLATRRFD